MTNSVTLCLALHNHQPIGNFDGVIEQAYRDSYLPFLEVFEPYEHLSISLHTSGPLMVWLAENHPEYIERVKALVAAERIEILGGPFYEPILTMLPSRDRIGQIARYTHWLQTRFQTEVHGMWMPERVWESQLTSDVVIAGMKYTILDDYHFLSAGCDSEALTSYYLTEDDGHVLRVFPGSERLRYTIPFADVSETIEFARAAAQRSPGCVLVLGDDGEKFGTWPDTHEHVYAQGWLSRFFDALTENREWLRTKTLNSAAINHGPAGRVYLPDCSYREMTEWALPVTKQTTYDQVTHQLAELPNWQQAKTFLRGGVWRNFRVKYSEANEMYCRMLEVSQRYDEAKSTAVDPALLPQIEDHLYRGQCNCPYWHGAFGGIYLPHLRNATYRELIAADTFIERAHGQRGTWVDLKTHDYNNDLFPEVRMASDKFVAYLAPAQGGMLYELDVRSAQHNLLATMQRRPEFYHDKIRSVTNESHQNHENQAASIHDRVVCKQEGLDQQLNYDIYPRKSMLEHFFDNDIDLNTVQSSKASERGDFVALPFAAKIRRGSGKIQVQLQREGNAWGVPIRLTKALTIESGSERLQCTYLFEGLPPGRPFHFASEWNFAGMPADADDRYFFNRTLSPTGHLGTCQDLTNTNFLGLIDQWLGIEIQMEISRASGLWTFPIRTVSQSEAGFEMVHQSVCVMPHWIIQGDSSGQWSVNLDILIASSHRPTARLNQQNQNEFSFRTADSM